VSHPELHLLAPRVPCGNGGSGYPSLTILDHAPQQVRRKMAPSLGLRRRVGVARATLTELLQPALAQVE
jgi:hypothetical protein